MFARKSRLRFCKVYREVCEHNPEETFSNSKAQKCHFLRFPQGIFSKIGTRKNVIVTVFLKFTSLVLPVGYSVRGTKGKQ